DEPLTLDGPGAGVITVAGNATSPSSLYDVNGSGIDVEISGLTLTEGSSSGLGAAVRSEQADLTISEVLLTGNAVLGSDPGYAGTIGSIGGSVTIENSTISDNTA